MFLDRAAESQEEWQGKVNDISLPELKFLGQRSPRKYVGADQGLDGEYESGVLSNRYWTRLFLQPLNVS